jgi:hypothetical protein
MTPDAADAIDKLDLSEPTAEQLSLFDKKRKGLKSLVDAGCYFIAANAGIKVELARKLLARDFTKALSYLREGDAEKGPPEYDGEVELVLTLKKPISLGEKDPNPKTELTLREPTAEQIIKFENVLAETDDEIEATYTLIALNVGLAPTYTKRMVASDFEKAAEFLTRFTPAPPKE